MEFKEKLKIVRDETGLSSKSISEKSGIGYDSLRMYSQGKRKPKVEQLKKLADVEELRPFSDLILEQSELSKDEGEFLRLVGVMKQMGKTEELDAILADLRAHASD